MKEWIVKSKINKELMLLEIEKEARSYTFSNVCASNAFLAKVKGNGELYLYYTGMLFQVRAMYWMHISFVEERGGVYLKIKQEFRPEIKFIYYIVPLIIWLVAIGVFLKKILMVLIVASIQIVLSTIVILMIKNIGRKKQIKEIFDFLKRNQIIDKNFIP